MHLCVDFLPTCFQIQLDLIYNFFCSFLLAHITVRLVMLLQELLAAPEQVGGSCSTGALPPGPLQCKAFDLSLTDAVFVWYVFWNVRQMLLPSGGLRKSCISCCLWLDRSCCPGCGQGQRNLSHHGLGPVWSWRMRLVDGSRCFFHL